MRFKPPKAANWFAEYAWAAFPESLQAAAEASNGALNADLNTVSEGKGPRQKSNLRSQRPNSAAKSVKFDPQATGSV